MKHLKMVAWLISVITLLTNAKALGKDSLVEYNFPKYEKSSAGREATNDFYPRFNDHKPFKYERSQDDVYSKASPYNPREKHANKYIENRGDSMPPAFSHYEMLHGDKKKKIVDEMYYTNQNSRKKSKLRPSAPISEGDYGYKQHYPGKYNSEEDKGPSYEDSSQHQGSPNSYHNPYYKKFEEAELKNKKEFESVPKKHREIRYDSVKYPLYDREHSLHDKHEASSNEVHQPSLKYAPKFVYEDDNHDTLPRSKPYADNDHKSQGEWSVGGPSSNVRSKLFKDKQEYERDDEEQYEGESFKNEYSSPDKHAREYQHNAAVAEDGDRDADHHHDAYKRERTPYPLPSYSEESRKNDAKFYRIPKDEERRENIKEESNFASRTNYASPPFKPSFAPSYKHSYQPDKFEDIDTQEYQKKGEPALKLKSSFDYDKRVDNDYSPKKTFQESLDLHPGEENKAITPILKGNTIGSDYGKVDYTEPNPYSVYEPKDYENEIQKTFSDYGKFLDYEKSKVSFLPLIEYKLLLHIFLTCILDERKDLGYGGFCDGRKNGLYPDLNSKCFKYFSCDYGRTHLFTCPYGTNFNVKLQFCDWKHRVKCGY